MLNLAYVKNQVEYARMITDMGDADAFYADVAPPAAALLHSAGPEPVRHCSHRNQVSVL